MCCSLAVILKKSEFGTPKSEVETPFDNPTEETIGYVIYLQRGLRVSSGYPNTENHRQPRGVVSGVHLKIEKGGKYMYSTK